MASLGTAYINVKGDFSALNRQLRSGDFSGRQLRPLERQTDRVGVATDRAARKQRDFRTSVASTGRSIGRFILASSAIYGVGRAVGGMVTEFVEARKTTAQTEAVLKSTGAVAGVTAKQIESLAESIALKSGMDDEAIQSSENVLLTFTSIRNEVGKNNDIFNQATEVITDMSVALGTDLKGSTIQVGKALQDPIKGITALRRVGVNFNEQQTEQIKKMVEAGNVLGAQKRILRELNTEFGGSAAAQATGLDRLRASYKNIQESLGKLFGPALESSAEDLAKFVSRITKILDDPNLTGEQKFDRISDMLAQVFEDGLNRATALAGRFGPRIAAALFKGFVQAPPVVQLVAGTWLFARSRGLLAAFGLLGTQAGAAFGTGVGTGVAGGAGGGAAVGGLAGLAGKLKGFAKRAGFVGAGIFAADQVLDGMKTRMDRGSEDLFTRLKGQAKGAGPLDLGGGDIQAISASRSLLSVLGAIQERHAKIDGLQENAARDAARALNLTREQRKEVQRILDIGRKRGEKPVAPAQFGDIAGVEAQVEKLGRLTPNLIANMTSQLNDLPRKTRPKFAQAVLDWATELKRDGKIKGSLRHLAATIELGVDGVGELSIKGPKRLKTRVAAGFEAMVDAVADPTSRMAQIVATYMEAFGAAGVGKISGAIARDKATRSKGHRGGLAKGGFLAGQGRKDTVPIMAAPGEAILNRHQQRPVETALRTTYGYGLNDLFRRQQKPHYMARGGTVGDKGIVPIPGQPGESIHASILKDVMALIKRYKLQVTDGYAPSGHAAGGEHPKGLAVDVVPGGGGSWDLVDRLAKWAEPKQGSPRKPFRWVGYTGDSGHGRGNHLHLSWGGGKTGVGGAGLDLPELGDIKISGRKSVTKDLAQAAVKKVTRAAKSFLADQAVDAPVGTSSDPGLGGSAAANKRLARSMMKGMFPASEFGALNRLWEGESGWNENAVNPSSGAGGIPQALPASKMGAGWQGNAAQQIKWGLNYIKGRYGTPSAALSAWQGRSPHWYAQGGFVEAIQEMYAGGNVTASQSKKDPKNLGKDGAKPKDLKKPPKAGGPSPGKGFKWDPAKYKWVKSKGKSDLANLPGLTALRKTLDLTIPSITDRIDAMGNTFDLTDEEFYPDEKLVPRLKREGHNVQKIGDSFVDWSAVAQKKSELSQLLGESVRLIGTPFGAGKGIMENLKDSFPVVVNRVDEVIARLKNEIKKIQEQVRENVRRMENLDRQIKRERDKKKKDRDEKKIKRLAGERDDLGDENSRLTGARRPESLKDISDGVLGKRIKRRDELVEDRDTLRDDSTTFMGASGMGGDFASKRNDIQRLATELGTLTDERLTETLGPSTAEANQDSQNALLAIQQLLKDYGRNFTTLPSFEGGGVIPGPKGKPIQVTAHGQEVYFDPRTGSFNINVKPEQIKGGDSGRVINVDARHTFAEVPPDPHTYSRTLKYELEAM